jgi:hypothetical protein
MTNHQKPAAVVHVDLDGASAIYTMHGWPYPHDTDPLFESGLENLLSISQPTWIIRASWRC